MPTFQQRTRAICASAGALILCAGLSACGSDDHCDGCVRPTQGYAGSISGLPAGASVLLQDNVGSNTTVSANGNFSFATYAPPGYPVLVGVLVQPPGNDCAVATGGVNPTGIVSVTLRCTPLAAGVTSLISDYAGMLSQGSAQGTGTAASFNNPNAIAADTAGNIYVADSGNNAIRQIAPGGIVSTLAGTAGTAGSANGTGAAALFNNPSGVATDSSGNVYVADTNNQTIRKVTPAGVVSTVAGSPGVLGSTDATGSAASFRYPNGLASDSSGNLYVADTGNNTIRKITPAGVVSTLAGTPGVAGFADGTGAAASFNGPAAVALDTLGNLYVADYYNNTIRKVSAAGVVSTIAGSAPFWGAVDDTGSAARFNGPQALVVDAVGNVYVADTNNDTVRKITPAGVVSTVIGVPGLAVFDAGILPGALQPSYGLALFGSSLYISTNNGVALVTNVP